MTNNIPVIETERMHLTAHSVEDFPSMLRMWQDPIATKHIPPGPLSREACWAIWLQYRGLWAGLGFGYWAIKEKATGAFMGEIGFADFKRDTTPPMAPMMELGTILHSDYHGQGYGHEAKCAVLNWQAQNFTLPVCCLILPDNQVAIKQAKKCGFSFNNLITYGGAQICLGLQNTPE
ncbi:RimJ/RimL family protein N-acetyltransferase [Erwinia toletana]|uniref:RimJ/RimL family protein N-acetyltransferase n=1 Tax=Winslowiella toletana TaxID=92490 RepID=A0ABS4P9U1_9GAMM|nr:GNAT family N-acetyltransferase [Winslowiella toletana]MBP2169416.1 RimJ/RimL family protein N-acetyltransferase [Winslowiella toletana]